jgi:hypothetical protein
MRAKSTLIAMAIIISSAAMLGSAPVAAQERPVKEGQRLRQLCNGGDQRACVRFGMLINENRTRHAEWRRSNPELFWYEGDRRNRAGSAGQAQGERGGTNLPWCGVPYGSTRECVYQSIAQCETDMRPLGGDCEPRD